MKTSFGPQRLFFPMPTCLVVTGNLKEANIVTIAWVSLLTSTPPTLGIAIGSKGFSADKILENNHFTVNIASTDIMVQADYCGIISGKDVNKFKKTGLTPMPSKYIDSPIIKECPVNFECRLTEHSMTGKTHHFKGEILEVYVDTDKLNNPNELGSINIEMISPLIYIGSAREYREIGKKIGDAYEVGKEIK